ncbi:homeodomain-like transcriptional regulator [Striga asiatica]|uniref:Homeodomain-like transcriptional regulator n=1 Tax=Striga asiatica TaxID=4170 RepID=A0A5A7QDS7_STRAF|nr:homeodomain-like transcriptional regulator [Striga asiatica]
MDIDEEGGKGESGGKGDGGVGVEAEKNWPEVERKVKRKMKTPFQLEVLEKIYSIDSHPSEALRAELLVKLGLTDRQLQMWFCHRRLKDRKAPTKKKLKRSALSSPDGIAHETVIKIADVAKGGFLGLDIYGNTNVQHKQQMRVAHKVGTAVPRISMESPPMRRLYEPPLAISEQRAIKFVEAQLEEPLREDGPILGMEFDPLPPGAFGAPIVSSEQQKVARRSYDPQLYERVEAKPVKGTSKALHEYQFLPEKPSARHDDTYDRATLQHFYGLPNPISNTRSVMHCNEQVSSEYRQNQTPGLHIFPQQSMREVCLSRGPREVDIPPSMGSMPNASIDAHLFVRQVTELAGKSITPDRRIILDHERLERKWKAEEARIAKEVEAHEKRIRKELERQDILRRKREEQMRKEIERQDRERRKEEERLMREMQREEERFLKEQRREMERREKFLRKEYIRAEKMRYKEEMRREKEAARLKAANNRTAARKIAKEPTELVEDERLELMELATLSKALPSILALDSETLENLDLLKGKLPEFPPESVPLKRPFKGQPWTDSEENISNVLMVWRFLIAFADVLGLWPFTLDEFTQALHDCDPRLLGEIHLALLRCIIKDIEDVARTPANAMAANQSSAFNPLGGHPHIVGGAYAWGFNLLSWKHLLTSLTWPECDDCAAAISDLRSGLAAENAVTLMQEKGFSHSRRKSRHRLTPGTVKYAAFHILTLEGSKGLSILEIADKIQRSGLRDLTTSKTPEASISAALSRDTKLFEKTAPSTYCVRSPYRMDPSNAEEILSAARDKILACQNGVLEEEEDEEEAEKVDFARDQESESDDVDDPDVDLDAAPKPNEASHHGKNSINALGNLESGVNLDRLVNEIKTKGETSAPGVESIGVEPEIVGHDLDNIINDECGLGEQWVQGLTEMEYADLSTEERLNALVALERLEAANALKKQMWTEAQLDKRRMKDEHILKFQHPSSIEHNRSPMSSVYVKNKSSLTNSVFRLFDLNNDHQDEENYCNSSITEKKPRSQLKALIGHWAEEIYIYRSLPLGEDRRRNRYWQFMTSSSKNDPGSGKLYVELCNGTWRVIDSAEGFDALLSSLDVRGIREYHLHSMLQNIEGSFKESARINLLRSNSILHSGEDFTKEVKHRMDLYFELENNINKENWVMARHKDFNWLWKECFDSNISGALKFGTVRRERLLEICTSCHGLFSWEDIHCPSCHRTYKTSDIHFSFAEHVSQCERKMSEGIIKGVSLDLSLPPRVKLLKAQLAFIEVMSASIPADAFNTVWSDEYRKSWGRKLYVALTAEDLLQTLTLLEDSIKREFLSSNYETTSELLNSSEAFGNCVETLCMLRQVSLLPWIPRTMPAVALRLMELDVSIYYSPDQKATRQKEHHEAAHFSKFPMNYSSSWAEPVNGPTILKRGRGRPRGPSRSARLVSKAQKKPIVNRRVKQSNVGPTKDHENDNFPSLPTWKGRKKSRQSTAGRKERRGSGRGKIVFCDTAVLRQERNMGEAGENAASSFGRSEFNEGDDEEVSAAGFLSSVGLDNYDGVVDDYYDECNEEQNRANGGGQNGDFDTSSDGGSSPESEYRY